MSEKRFTIINKEEPRGQSVAEKGIPCTARHCCTRLNRLTEENEQLKQKNQLLYEDIDFLKRFIEKRGFKAKLESDKKMTKKRFWILNVLTENSGIKDRDKLLSFDEIVDLLNNLSEENEQLRSQLYCDDEEGSCNICKHHFLVKDDETELGYYNSRCKKGHYECARISLKHCEDFEKGDIDE